MDYPIANYCIKVSIDGHSEPQLVSKHLLKFSVRELHNSMVSPTEEGGPKEARDVENDITVSYSMVQSILPPQLKKMYARNKVVVGC